MSYKYLFKYILVGDSGVGKTCLLLQFTDKRFNSIHDVTIGVEFGSKTLRVPVNVSGTSTIAKATIIVRAQIWDTAGQETFRSITQSYYRNATIVILVYDITRRSSFNHIDKWYNECKEQSGDRSLCLILVGNKSDQEYRREVSTKEAKEYADSHDMLFIETSAMKSIGVENVFMLPAQKICSDLESGVMNWETAEKSGIKAGFLTNTNNTDTPERMSGFHLLPLENNHKHCCDIV